MPRKKKRNPQPSPPPSTIDSCKYCQKSHLKLSKCSKCKEVLYCSVDCQKNDWVIHKESCKPKISEQQSRDPPLPNKEEICNNCGKSGNKTCAQCKKAKYCSRECQKAAWPKHKADCQKNPALLQTSLKVPANVHSIARKRYPGFQLITDFEHVDPVDCMIQRKQVLLVLMHEPGGHPFRPHMVVRDEKGIKLQLIFYLQEDDRPNPLEWNQFRTGNYVCIMYPEIHYFRDFTVGFRVESTSLVSFIRPSEL